MTNLRTRQHTSSITDTVRRLQAPVGEVADQSDGAPVFMPLAGTEGYNPVADVPYIVAGAIGYLRSLSFHTCCF